MTQNLKLIIIAILVFLISMSVGMLVTNNFEAGKSVFPHSALQNNLILANPKILKGVESEKKSSEHTSVPHSFFIPSGTIVGMRG